jgi:5-formaminoimidazole-4-carboxamide-1-(beta)-D-ribofuranosyl 5'-monophosphate synthetase
MVDKQTIDSIIKEYNANRPSDITIATIASHSAQQIVMGARKAGFRTALIAKDNEIDRLPYTGFSQCRPDMWLTVKDFKDILDEKFQEKLIQENSIVIPHGSFVAYVGPDEFDKLFKVPTYGNRKTLQYECSRKKQREWLLAAGLSMPRQYDSIDDIPFGEEDAPKLFLAKYPGAPGGKNFFKFETKAEFSSKVLLAQQNGKISEADVAKIIIQAYVPGNRHYLHFFATPFFDKGLKVMDECWLELLSEDRRDETVDELHRIGFDHNKLMELGIDADYEVSGNIQLILREKLLSTALDMGRKVLLKSYELMGGMPGPFCLETMVTSGGKFCCFEISTRLVAGTNLFTAEAPHPYTVKTWGRGMSHGDRIALEIEEGIKRDELTKIIY